MRPSRLYRRLGLTGPLLSASVGTHDLGDRVYSLNIQRGGTSLSGHTPATITVETPERVTISGGQTLDVSLTTAAATALAARAGNATATEIQDRFNGRVATQSAHDLGDHKGRWRGSTVIGAAWSSVLEHAPNTWTPTTSASLAQAAAALFQPAWEPRAQHSWQGTPDTWHGPGDPITARDLKTILLDRLHVLSDRRNGQLLTRTLDDLEARSLVSSTATWPLARAHCQAPTTWEQPASYPTEYRVQVRTTTGIAEIITGETPSGTTRVEDLDWTEFVDRSEQWRRVYGLRWESLATGWRLPSVTVRLDHLLDSHYEGHRRAAGMLLTLNVGDPIPLAGDWPAQLEGIHIVTGMDERITPDAWSLNLSLVSYRALAGELQLPIKPRTWDQAGTRTWDQAGTATWNQGVPA